MKWYVRLTQPFRFIARRHARQALARMREWRTAEAERTHQRDMAKLFLTALETMQETSVKETESHTLALMEIAKAQASLANGFAEWMKTFQMTSAPTTSIVREEDEYEAEQARRGIVPGLPPEVAAMSPEFQLAWALQNDPSLASS